MVERVDETANIYTSQLDTLMNMLKEHSETSGDSIKYLTFRLDFNNFYTSKLK